MLSPREETPELALPDRVQLLPSRVDGGLVGEAGIGCRDWGGQEGPPSERHSQGPDHWSEHQSHTICCVEVAQRWGRPPVCVMVVLVVLEGPVTAPVHLRFNQQPVRKLGS